MQPVNHSAAASSKIALTLTLSDRNGQGNFSVRAPFFDPLPLAGEGRVRVDRRGRTVTKQFLVAMIRLNDLPEPAVVPESAPSRAGVKYALRRRKKPG